jgi:hypothetical protein
MTNRRRHILRISTPECGEKQVKQNASEESRSYNHVIHSAVLVFRIKMIPATIATTHYFTTIDPLNHQFLLVQSALWPRGSILRGRFKTALWPVS